MGAIYCQIFAAMKSKVAARCAQTNRNANPDWLPSTWLDIENAPAVQAMLLESAARSLMPDCSIRRRKLRSWHRHQIRYVQPWTKADACTARHTAYGDKASAPTKGYPVVLLVPFSANQLHKQ